jgi:hypothetical protein
MTSPEERLKERIRAGVKSGEINKDRVKAKKEASRKEGLGDRREKAVATRRSTRTVRKPVEAIIAAKVHIDGPYYTPADNVRAGGKRSRATLGPGAVGGLGSDSVSDKPAAITRAREVYEIAFISGHLLNADFGGAGEESSNLTILTPGANGSHKSFDSPVLKAVRELANVYKSLHVLGMDVEALNYGIKVVVSTKAGTWAASSPGNCISTGLTCTAEVVGRPSEATILAELPPAEADRVTGWAAKLEAAKDLMASVGGFVAEANDNGDVDNSQP